MPHSLRARLSGLRYKKIISDKDYDRLCKALDNEGVLDKIRVEIGRQYKWLINTRYTIRDVDIAFDSIFRFIDKYKAESEDKE